MPTQISKEGKKDDRRTGTVSVILYGSEMRELRQKDLERWKRRLTRRIAAQIIKEFSDTPILKQHQLGMNDGFEIVIKMIKAKWKNI